MNTNILLYIIIFQSLVFKFLNAILCGTEGFILI